MPEGAELWRKTGQRGFLIISYKRLGKNSDRAVTPATEAVCVPAHFTPPGFLQPEQLHNLHAQLSLGQNCHRQKKKKILGLCTHGRFSPTLCISVDCGLPGFSVREEGFSRQEYWSVLANTGCHTLLDHYISCCPSLQPP